MQRARPGAVARLRVAWSSTRPAARIIPSTDSGSSQPRIFGALCSELGFPECGGISDCQQRTGPDLRADQVDIESVLIELHHRRVRLQGICTRPGAKRRTPFHLAQRHAGRATCAYLRNIHSEYFARIRVGGAPDQHRYPPPSKRSATCRIGLTHTWLSVSLICLAGVALIWIGELTSGIGITNPAVACAPPMVVMWAPGTGIVQFVLSPRARAW